LSPGLVRLEHANLAFENKGNLTAAVTFYIYMDFVKILWKNAVTACADFSRASWLPSMLAPSARQDFFSTLSYSSHPKHSSIILRGFIE